VAWKKYIRPNGYGQTTFKGKKWQAHRLTWTLANGAIPPGMVIMHRCDNRRCVNLEHLLLGTMRINNYDMCAKGRHVSVKGYTMNRGEAHGNTNLTTEYVKEIKELLKYPITQKEIGKYYGVNKNTISDINVGRRWKHIISN
jgi:hypothetical protein